MVTGSVHVQGEELNSDSIEVTYINKWVERPASKKFLSYIKACFKIYWLLVTKYRSYEVFFVSIPPMGYLLNLMLPHRFSMVIWDVYPDIFKITGMQESASVIQNLELALNRKSFKKAFQTCSRLAKKWPIWLRSYVDRTKIIIQPIWSIFQQNERVSKTQNPFIKPNINCKINLSFNIRETSD